MGAPAFEIISPLGTGGFGEVKLALMRRDGVEQLVALKRIRKDLIQVIEYALQFDREARICAQLDHPHVVRLAAFGTDDLGPYLALEFIDGKSAADLEDEYDERKQ